MLIQAPFSIEQVWRQAASLLTESDSAQLDAQLLLLKILNKNDRAYLHTWPEKILTETQILAFEQDLQQRLAGKPVAHILGFKEFWGLELQVNASTLIPRPDTEIVIDTVLNLYQSKLMSQIKVLDLGTGTGAIALAIKSECPQWQVDAVEYSAPAYQLAKSNAERLNLPINVYQGSWFEPLKQGNNSPLKYDLIVSNPPYIDKNDPHLVQGDVRYEPESALIANDNGLSDIKHIIEQSPNYLTKQAWLIIEHGYQQAQAVQSLFNLFPHFKHIQTQPDLSGQPRITFAQFY
ncbi:peptide chain release factor N(5)-glutamine methyltransferase [Catenovulum adriaticum]|uniref:Release factor glutamine methyltransferase n=1 Tax=Catenovulum adriaticum TaxID=2984846 RepID=A0ABY7ASI6_9ALTE|nr:peptide chain release factor N(5)-glutamine methyltransferase [Catenovulum sp. TS8]WAJ71329.1 peptide chain release factor N(5)-glutamine methyltransferase [Catenovulum sp. TS8]